jgi:hypothetical protein
MRFLGGKVGKPEADRPNFGVSDAPDATTALADQVSDGVAEGNPVGVSVDIGELAGVVGEIDIGSHIASSPWLKSAFGAAQVGIQTSESLLTIYRPDLQRSSR